MWHPSEGAPKPDYLLKLILNMAANSSRVSGYSHSPSSAAHLHGVEFVQPPIRPAGAIKHMIQLCWSTKDKMNKVRVQTTRSIKLTKETVQHNMLVCVIKQTTTLAEGNVFQDLGGC